MERVLLVDISISGHRLGYIGSLRVNDNFLCLLPENSTIDFAYIKMKSEFINKRNLTQYISFISEINSVIEREKINVVHLLCGDVLYRYFGFYLRRIKTRVIVTFHNFLFNGIRIFSYKIIFDRISKGVVHTDSLYRSLKKIGIENVVHIEYPALRNEIASPVYESRAIFNLPVNKKILSIVGGTSGYKGYDVLFKALDFVKSDFHLFICGREIDYTESEIKKQIEGYQDKVTLVLRFLEEIEYEHAINASDIILLPYKSSISGASGPLADSTVYRKTVITSNQSSLGSIVKKNHLGFVFESGNNKELAKVIDEALDAPFKWDDFAEGYRASLDVKQFCIKYKAVYEVDNTYI